MPQALGFQCDHRQPPLVAVRADAARWPVRPGPLLECCAPRRAANGPGLCRRELGSNAITGSLPSSLSALTRLTILCGRLDTGSIACYHFAAIDIAGTILCAAIVSSCSCVLARLAITAGAIRAHALACVHVPVCACLCARCWMVLFIAMAEAVRRAARPCLRACGTAAVRVERVSAAEPAHKVCRLVESNFLTGSVPPALLNMTKSITKRFR